MKYEIDIHPAEDMPKDNGYYCVVYDNHIIKIENNSTYYRKYRLNPECILCWFPIPEYFEHFWIYGREKNDDSKAIDDSKNAEPTTINHPSYYQNDGMETIDVIRALTKNLSGIEAFCIGNAIKYISRFKGKGGSEDIEKAVWYLQYLIGKNKN